MLQVGKTYEILVVLTTVMAIDADFGVGQRYEPVVLQLDGLLISRGVIFWLLAWFFSLRWLARMILLGSTWTTVHEFGSLTLLCRAQALRHCLACSKH